MGRRRPRSPKRPSQIVHETSAATPEGQHIKVTLERTSTGGTRREAAFKRGAAGPMSGAERAEKKRLKKSLFPDDQARSRTADAKRKRESYAAEKTVAKNRLEASTAKQASEAAQEAAQDAMAAVLASVDRAVARREHELYLRECAARRKEHQDRLLRRMERYRIVKERLGRDPTHEETLMYIGRRSCSSPDPYSCPRLV